MLKFRDVAFATACCLLFLSTGCSGGGGVPTVPRSIAATPAPPATSGPSSPTTASLRVTIPLATSPAAKRRRPAYLSPATNSLTIVENGAAPQLIALGASSPNCTTSATARTCNVTFAAIAATNANFLLKTFASSDGSGTPLSVQAVVATIVAGTANTLTFTLDGVPAKLTVFLSNPNLPAGTSGSTNVIVNALDASGAVIIGPGTFADVNGNPIVVTLANSDASGATQLAQTSIAQGSTVALRYSGNVSITSATISASAPALTPASAVLSLVPSGTPFNATQVAAALSSVANTYSTMPHVSITADLQALATSMTASGAFATATLAPGGIAATLPDGTATFVFADRVEDLYGGANAQAKTRASTSRHPQAATSIAATIDAPSQHQYVFLTNNSDQYAFDPSNQNGYARAYHTAGIAPPNAGVESLDITLDNIVALGASTLDDLEIATHGGIGDTVIGGTPFGSSGAITGGMRQSNQYLFTSTTPITPANNTKYAKDIAAGLLDPTITLLPIPYAYVTPTYGFTAGFLAKYLHFNPGATVFNYSCDGQNPTITNDVGTRLKNAGVGRYYGWTQPVFADDADGTQAYIIDRVLGSDRANDTLMSFWAPDPATPQQGFPLDTAYAQLAQQTRIATSSFSAKPYAFNVSGTGATQAVFAMSDFGEAAVATPPDEFAFPSITTVSVAERPSSATLTINGHFPSTQGTVQMVKAVVGATIAQLPVVTWTPTQIVATIPVDGTGSTGYVQVSAADGGTSNSVPLTQWTGTFNATETDQIPDVPGKSGTGLGTITNTFNVAFRADVHPVVQSIDQAAVPQNLYFTNVEGDSTGTFTGYSGSFDSSDGILNVTWALSQSPPTLVMGTRPLTPPAFAMLPVPGQPASCNNALPGVQSGPSNVFCPGIGYVAQDVSTCVATTTDGSATNACQGGTSVAGEFGDGKLTHGLLVLTMDPASYAITVTSQPAQGASADHFGGNGRSASGDVTGTISAPLNAPQIPEPLPSGASAPTGGSGTTSVRRSSAHRERASL